MTVDLKVVEDKLSRGESLTKEEMKEVMSLPPDGTSNQLSPEDDIKDEDYHEGDPNKEANEKAAADKAAADKKAADEKAEADKAAKPNEDAMVRLNRELDKPEGKEDLKGWSESEKAYFWEMRRSRKRAQKAEEDLDVIKRENLKKKKDDEAKAIADAETKEEEDLFKDRGEDEPLTVKDMKLLMKRTSKKLTPVDTETKPRNVFDQDSPLIASALKAQDQLARAELGEDYDETVECTQEIIANNPVYLRQIADALIKGENVAKLTYTLIKGDPEFTKVLPIAQGRLKAAGKATTSDKKTEEKKPDAKTAEALEKQKKLEANQTKDKTSAHVPSGGDDKSGSTGEYTADQLLKMSDAEFRKVPKKIRDAFLKGDA